ncbi:hypothetical protein [Leifsonia poae]|uniref:hypothetical protein n=1 Tax=Leifsonia poae TaxID=110933 RepID=UPI001CC1311E|nr:hypothetical protein [Leifsonia poae]
MSRRRRSLNPRLAVLAVLAVAALLLSGCAASSPPAGSAPASRAAADAATTASSAPAAGGNPVNGADFCALLTGLEPRLSTDGSTAGALADLSIEFASWLDTHAEQKPRTAADLDDASRTSCPEVRTSVLKALGADSFDRAFNG